MFVTLFVATLNTQTGQLTYSLAGHNPPLVLGRDGSVQWLPGDSGTALGIVESARFCTRTTTLGPGDGLILYTDGISEALNSQLEEFGEARLMALLQKRDWTPHNWSKSSCRRCKALPWEPNSPMISPCWRCGAVTEPPCPGTASGALSLQALQCTATA
jgi:hypothetical protein